MNSNPVESERPNSWSLMRLDDNGNRCMIKTCSDKKEAEKAMEEFESKGHKHPESNPLWF